MSLTRYAAILDERGIVPFQRIPWVNPRTKRVEPRVLGERLPMQWRISRDEWDRLVAADPAVDASIEQQIAGWTVIVDDALPPGSVLFEER